MRENRIKPLQEEMNQLNQLRSKAAITLENHDQVSIV